MSRNAMGAQWSIGFRLIQLTLSKNAEEAQWSIRFKVDRVDPAHKCNGNLVGFRLIQLMLSKKNGEEAPWSRLHC